MVAPSITAWADHSVVVMTPRRPQTLSHRWFGASAATLLVLGALAACGQPSASSDTTTDTTTATSAGSSGDDDTFQASIDGLVEDGYPAALASVLDTDGTVHDYTAGVGDVASGEEVPVDGYVRIGSNTKTFTAVVVLQLVGEGLIELDEPVETYLPGLVRGAGIDGSQITVRQLLQHTSGLPNYTSFLAAGMLPFQHTYLDPRALLDLALAEPAESAPGTSWSYSNTNYLLAGLIVEKVTGRPIGEEITTRIIEPVGLEHTYFPTVGDETIREPHPHGYHRDDPEGELTDATEWDPSMGWAAGQMIATPSDLNLFFAALLDGELLEPAELDAMRTTIDAPGPIPGTEYGLGLMSTPLSCGGLAWGHGGSIPGYSTTNAVTEDGRGVTIAVTELPTTEEQIVTLTDAVDEALCA